MSLSLRMRAVVAVVVLAAPLARAVTLPDDALPHLWHSFQTPDNAFQGAAGYTGPAWSNTDAGALYVEWGGFIPQSRGTWVFVTPTVGISSNLSVVLNETSRTGLLTGSGNIYGLAFGQVPGPPLVFDLTLSDADAASYTSDQTRTFVMRSGTKGTLPDMNVSLNGVAARAWVATFRVDGSIDMPTGPGGAMEPNLSSDAEWLWLWEDVPVSATYRFDFRSLVGHMSLDNLVVYASPPGTPPPVPTQRSALVSSFSLASQLAAVVEEETLLAGLARRFTGFFAALVPAGLAEAA